MLGFSEGIAPTLPLTVTEWADERRILDTKSSEPGPWRTSRTPYLKDIMDDLSPHSPVREVVLVKGTQLGGTEAGLNWIGHTVEIDPGPMMVVVPNLTLARDYSAMKISPMIELQDGFGGRIRMSSSREAGNTALYKEFPGGFLNLTGSNSAAGLRFKSIQKLFLDDVDAFEEDADGEGDPVALAEKRLDSFRATCKIFKCSSPKRIMTSRIWQAFLNSDQRYFYVPCPHCGEMQVLVWENFRFEYEKPGYILKGDVEYLCKHCGAFIEEYHKTAMMEAGEWRAHNPGHENRGYHLPSFYSPLGRLSWRDIAKDFLQARKVKKTTRNNGEMQTFKNTRQAEPWEEDGEGIEELDLMGRREAYNAEVPMDVAILTCAVDVQRDRLEAEVTGFGVGMESWPIEKVIMLGNPSEPRVWKELDILRAKSWTHESGASMGISLTFVDSGDQTQTVYNYVRPRWPKVWAIKGAKVEKSGDPLILNLPKKTDLSKDVYVVNVNGYEGKDLLYSWLKLTTPGPGFCHFPNGAINGRTERENERRMGVFSAMYGHAHFEQLTSEKKVPKWDKKTGRRKYVWHLPSGMRNEALDLRIYNMAAVTFLVLYYQDSLESRHKRLLRRAKTEKENGPAPAPKKARPRRSGGFVSGLGYRL